MYLHVYSINPTNLHVTSQRYWTAKHSRGPRVGMGFSKMLNNQRLDCQKLDWLITISSHITRRDAEL
jgi:hypothetical protein